MSVLNLPLPLSGPNHDHFKDNGVLTARCMLWSTHRFLTITTKTTACWLHAVRCFNAVIITIAIKMTACWLHAVCFEAPIASLRSLQRRLHADCTVLKLPSPHYDHYNDDGVLTLRCLFWSTHRLITIITKTTACWLHAVCFEAPIASFRSLQRQRHADCTLSDLRLPLLLRCHNHDHYKDEGILTARCFEAPTASLRSLLRLHAVCFEAPIASLRSLQRLHAVCFETPTASLRSLQRLHAVCFEAPIASLRSLQRRRHAVFTLSVLKHPSPHYDRYKDDGMLSSRYLFWSTHRLITITTKTTVCCLHAVCFEACLNSLSLRSVRAKRRVVCRWQRTGVWQAVNAAFGAH